MLMALGAATAKAQHALEPGKPYAAYCNINGYNTLGIGKVKVNIDFGLNWKGGCGLYDENQKEIKFNTMVDVLDYMAKRGWVLKTTTSSYASKSYIEHYIMEKIVTDDSQITEGLIIRKEETKKKSIDDIMGNFQ